MRNVRDELGLHAVALCALLDCEGHALADAVEVIGGFSEIAEHALCADLLVDVALRHGLAAVQEFSEHQGKVDEGREKKDGADEDVDDLFGIIGKANENKVEQENEGCDERSLPDERHLEKQLEKAFDALPDAVDDHVDDGVLPPTAQFDPCGEAHAEAEACCQQCDHEKTDDDDLGRISFDVMENQRR